MDHINLALETGRQGGTGFRDVSFVHQSIPDVALDAIKLETEIGGLSLSSPIFVNAMTGGGGDRTYEINRSLAIAARKAGFAMAVGSQMSALKNPKERLTFEIVRKENPEGIIFANLGSEASPDQAKEAVEMIKADALQIHLNIVQELAMPEGDRDFRGVLKRLETLAAQLKVPIIVKETGFGISFETAELLRDTGIAGIDVSGAGGTSFGAIENRRRKRVLPFFDKWGIPTAASIVEAKTAAPHMPLIASGGVMDSLQAAKSLALGADAAAISGFFLKILLEKGEEALLEEMLSLKEELIFIMAALGAVSIKELQRVPLVISGQTWHWLDQRGINTKFYCQRRGI